MPRVTRACNGAMLTWSLSLCLTVGASPQGEAEWAKRLAAGRPLVTAVGVGTYVDVAPDGWAVAAVDHEAHAARILDTESGEVAMAPHEGEVFAVALASAGRGYWLGLANGSIVYVGSDGERTFAVLDGRPIDGLERRGPLLAWSSAKADRGGVVDAHTGAAKFAVDAELGGYRRPRVRLSPDARQAIYYEGHPQQGGRRLLVVVDAQTGERMATASAYLSHRDCSHACGLAGIFSASRVASGRWQLQRLDRVTLASSVVDDNMRGGHFVDLMLSPNERFLLEGDHEEGGCAVYDLVGDRARRMLGDKGVLPVGFLAATGEHEELALTTSAGERGLAAWSAVSGEAVAWDLPFAEGKRVLGAGSLRDGRAVWLLYRQRVGGESVVHLEVVAVRR